METKALPDVAELINSDRDSERDSQLTITVVLVKQEKPNGSPIGKRKRDDENEICEASISSVKKSRMTIDKDKPTVHVNYGSLPRKSKDKLEELLQQWSEWHAQHCSPTHDSHTILESGEGTYFPALRVGVDNCSAVAFWMNNPLIDHLNRESVSVDCKTAPLYDRDYSLEGDSKKLDGFRCFNCGSYSHSLNECPKPRDSVAINNARTQYQSNNNQKSCSRVPTRYYQNSPAGKYDGLVPGVLQEETRRLLGLAELDPPPWLHRMNQIGYPPGYLDSDDDDDQPSGITIFADEENKEENENNGKPHETDSPRPRPPRKRSVNFPGVNAPIPNNADKRKWTAPPKLNFPSPTPNYLSQPSACNYQRWQTDGSVPPGCDPGLIRSPFSISPVYASQNYSQSNLSAFPMVGSPTIHTSPLAYSGSVHSGSPPITPYMRPQLHGSFSPVDYSLFGYERQY